MLHWFMRHHCASFRGFGLWRCEGGDGVPLWCGFRLFLIGARLHLCPGGYLLVSEVYHALAAGVAACFWKVINDLTPEIVACWMEGLPEQRSIENLRSHSFWTDRKLYLVRKRISGPFFLSGKFGNLFCDKTD
jgi:hypothetical protein